MMHQASPPLRPRTANLEKCGVCLVLVAQWIECLPAKEEVVGSNPIQDAFLRCTNGNGYDTVTRLHLRSCYDGHDLPFKERGDLPVHAVWQ
jgi:hypothetical protein